jgi:DNA-binding response OmpR family regulator
VSRRKILIVEDDPAIRRVLDDALRLAGYETLVAGTFAEGLEQARAPIDLALLDRALPGGDGLELLTRLRAARPALPAIVVTARGQELDRLRGLALADDYVVKPFSIREVLARVEAVLRRSAARPIDLTEVAFGGGVVDLGRRVIALAGGERREISEREAEIVRYLATNRRPISRDELLQQIWRLAPNRVRTRAVDMHVARLRDKLGSQAAIRTVRGKGYEWVG